MKLFKLITLFSLLSLLISCGTARYATIGISDNTPQCKVYVFRDSFTLIWSVGIEANGKAYGKLSDNTYLSFPLEVGKHTIEANWNFLAGGVDLEVPVACNNNENVYVVFYGYVSGSYRHIKGGIFNKEDVKARFLTHKNVIN